MAPYVTIPAQADCFPHLGVDWGGGGVSAAHLHWSRCIEEGVQKECACCATLKSMLMLLPPVDGCVVKHLLLLVRLREAGHLNQVIDTIQCLLWC